MEDKLHLTLQTAQKLQELLNRGIYKQDQWVVLFTDLFELFKIDQSNSILYHWISRSIIFATIDQQLHFFNLVMPLLDLSDNNEKLWSIVYVNIQRIPIEKISLIQLPKEYPKYLNQHCARTIRYINQHIKS